MFNVQEREYRQRVKGKTGQTSVRLISERTKEIASGENKKRLGGGRHSRARKSSPSKPSASRVPTPGTGAKALSAARDRFLAAVLQRRQQYYRAFMSHDTFSSLLRTYRRRVVLLGAATAENRQTYDGGPHKRQRRRRRRCGCGRDKACERTTGKTDVTRWRLGTGFDTKAGVTDRQTREA